MKIKLPKNKKKKLNPVIIIVVSLLIVGLCVSCGTNSEDEISTDTSHTEVTSEIKKTDTEKTTKTTTTQTTTETTITEKTTELTTTQTTTKATTTEKTTEPTTTQTTTETTTETTTKATTIEKTVEMVECPDLSGINYDEAIKMYSAYITIKKDSEEHSSYISAGSIIEQDIKFPSKVEKGTVVKVKVSLGPVAVQTTPPQAVQPAQSATIHFILNTDTNCIHIKDTCRAAQQILPENYSTVDIAESDLSNYNGIYWACGICSKAYSNIIPKFDK